MKRLIWIGFLVLLFSLPAYSQFWIHFEWNAPTCADMGIIQLRLSIVCVWRETGNYNGFFHPANLNCMYIIFGKLLNGFTIISVGMITRIIRTIIPHETVTGMKIRIGEEIGLMHPVRPEKPVAPRPPVGRPVPPAHEGRPSGRPEKPSKGPSFQQDKDHKKDHPSKGSGRYSGSRYF